MRRWISAALLVVIALAGAGAEAGKKRGKKKRAVSHDATVEHRFPGLEQSIARYEPSDRDEWQRPQLILRVLGLDGGERVADLGTGTGYLLPWLSAIVTHRGQVYAVDVEQELLDHIAQREDIADNVTTILADFDDPKLPSGELDIILIVNTWHHINDRLDYLEHLAAGLRPGGRVVVIDYHAGELPVGPPPDHKISRQHVLDEFAKAGWTLGAESVGLPYQYFLLFHPPTATTRASRRK